VDCVGDSTSVLCILEANCVNVAIRLAAAILCGKTIFCDAFSSHIESVFQTRVNSIKSVTQAIGDATQLSVYILVVKSLKEVGASDCSLDCGIAVAVAITEQTAATKDCEPYEVDKLLCCGITDSVIPLYVAIKNRLYLLLKEKSCTSD
jgi:hypothetical protein